MSRLFLSTTPCFKRQRVSVIDDLEGIQQLQISTSAYCRSATCRRKLVIILSLMVISGATLATLKAIFHPPDTIDFDFGWTCGFQFMMLFFMGDSIAKLKPSRIAIFIVFMAIWTTSTFFAFDMWL